VSQPSQPGPLPDLPDDLSPLLRHLESCYPSEGCGFLLRGPSGALRTRPVTNAYDRYRALEPESFPHTSRTAFLFDPQEQLAVNEEVRARGEEVACIFHSHVDNGAFFSPRDRDGALLDGEPLFPGVSYLVVAVSHGRATAARLFRFEDGDFRELPVPLPVTPRGPAGQPSPM